MKTLNITFATLIAILFIMVVVLALDEKGYNRGFKDGVTTALDSVNAIATQQLNNQTISSKFYIQSTDTLEFILSPKTIKMK